MIQGGKVVCVEFIFNVNGFDIQTGFGSHLPGIAFMIFESETSADPLW